jgi:hypothetical protein
MDSNTFIYLGVLIVAIIIPFVIHHYNLKRKHSKLMDELTGKDKNVVLTHHDLWRNNYAIGLDAQKKTLYYLNKLKNVHSVIELSAAESCGQFNNSRTVKSDGRHYNISDRLDLVISYKDKSKDASLLEFYDHTEYMTSDGEVPLIEKWEKLINSGMRK